MLDIIKALILTLIYIAIRIVMIIVGLIISFIATVAIIFIAIKDETSKEQSND